MRLISISSRSISPSFRCASDNSSNWNFIKSKRCSNAWSADSKSSNSFFWLYNFEKFGDIYPTNLDNVILRNYPIMLNGILFQQRLRFMLAMNI